ncbi:MAG: N-acetyltransferase [Alphaproteobacteria bacterium]|nr:N-acetyltransferase [Alphaproteobacteria bacterium]
MEIREEIVADHEAVRAVHNSAFGQSTEATLVDALRRDGDAEISLVAVVGDAVIGHIMLSRLTAPVRALALAPVAVAPSHQNNGVGSKLILESLKRAKAQGWEAVFVLGEPAYYSRFGFSADIAQAFISPYAGPYFMALELVDDALVGKGEAVGYAQAFSAL